MNSADAKRFLEKALEQAQKAENLDEVPIGAVVVFENRIIGVGHNLRETDQNPVAHAEVLALQDAARAIGSWRLSECSLVVTLEPCPMCLGACQQARVKEVVFGAADPKGGALSLGYKLHEDGRTNHRFPVQHEPDSACGAILSEFFKKKRLP